MKRFTIIILLFSVVIIYLLFTHRKTNPDRWTNQQAWKKLEKGITQQRVLELLGKPGQVIRRAEERWYYHKLPKKIHKYPENGFVAFRPENLAGSEKVKWTVDSWVEPDWMMVQSELKNGKIKHGLD
jgi:outer membrane protein assembly factor BamE (lipoprotein component of BamABCDE complex)